MSEKIFAQKKFTKNYKQHGKECNIVATAELHSLGGQHAYFSLTAETREAGRLESCGMMHDEIIKHFPKLQSAIKWHLVSTDEPLHYIQNSLYWAGLLGWTDGKKDSPPNYDYLVNTCKWGVLDEDSDIDLTAYLGQGDKKDPDNKEKSETLTKILSERLPFVQKEFKIAMLRLFEEKDVQSAFQYVGK